MSETNISVRVSETAHNYQGCLLIAQVLARIGDKWTVLVVGALSRGPVRYNQIQRTVEGISQRMLTLTLKRLEQDGIVKRTMFPTIPPRVEYELTDLGHELVVPLGALHAWALKYQPAIVDARARYAEKERENAKLAE
ncbi:winged helix-turn-helix transcriptional regulator [Pseudomonas gessardii]|uniref:Helix-turn-helix transcriptional regulator n=1 Tax=Pseudomonas gessardii TaxID=78544 RepID=A0A7Y1QN83_9PSED|nr:helix-turn-helix domain-containing protein [Pseudomonas gessardii]NNA88680.1 helix-turn-helix transcriptional regulator [Pseudomonas gessardii]NNA97624.1 helix-turn-helix transcriptional regulator [Pseudomonas gessardii]